MLNAHGRVRGQKGGLLKIIGRTLEPDDNRIRSLRGNPFWEAAWYNLPNELRARKRRSWLQHLELLRQWGELPKLEGLRKGPFRDYRGTANVRWRTGWGQTSRPVRRGAAGSTTCPNPGRWE